MPANDRLFSLRTVAQIVAIVVLGGGIGFSWNAVRGSSDYESSRRKHITIDKQYFPASVLVQRRAQEGTSTGTPPANGETDPTANGTSEPENGATGTEVPPPDPGDTTGTGETDPSGGGVVPPADELPADGLQRLSLADCQDLAGSEIAVFVDARERSDYVEGHIPGAVHLYHYDSASRIDEVRPILEAAFMIIVYCNGGDCEDSINLAYDLVASYGLPNENVYVFEDGMDVWKAAGLAVVKGENRE